MAPQNFCFNANKELLREPLLVRACLIEKIIPNLECIA